MKNLYYNFALKNKGVSNEDFLAELQNVAGISFESFFQNYVHGCNAFESIITEAFEYLGLELIQTPSKSYSAGRLGLKAVFDGTKVLVQSVFPGSPVDLGGIMYGDQIIGVNSVQIQNDLDSWLEFFDDDVKKLTVVRANRIVELTLPEVNRNFYSTYAIKQPAELNTHQRRAYEAWKK